MYVSDSRKKNCDVREMHMYRHLILSFFFVIIKYIYLDNKIYIIYQGTHCEHSDFIKASHINLFFCLRLNNKIILRFSLFCDLPFIILAKDKSNQNSTQCLKLNHSSFFDLLLFKCDKWPCSKKDKLVCDVLPSKEIKRERESKRERERKRK